MSPSRLLHTESIDWTSETLNPLKSWCWESPLSRRYVLLNKPLLNRSNPPECHLLSCPSLNKTSRSDLRRSVRRSHYLFTFNFWPKTTSEYETFIFFPKSSNLPIQCYLRVLYTTQFHFRVNWQVSSDARLSNLASVHHCLMPKIPIKYTGIIVPEGKLVYSKILTV